MSFISTEKEIPDRLKGDIKQYHQLDQEIKAATKIKDPLNKVIKEQMKELELSEFEHDGVYVKYDVQNRQSMNETKLIETLKKLGLTEAIKTIEVPDQAVIEDLMYNHKLDASALSHCIEYKSVEVLTVKGKK